MKYAVPILLCLCLCLTTVDAPAYPLDGANATGIMRLEGYKQRRQPKGARLDTEQVDIRLTERKDLAIPEETDAYLQREVMRLLGDDADNYYVAVLDLSDPDNPAYAEHQGLHRQNPGSVGKVVVGLAIFQALADIYPDDIDKRWQILEQTMVTADDFILSDHHKVPFYNEENNRLSWRPVEKGDTANLFTYLDWMFSASSNAAAAMCMREAMLMNHFQEQYPVSEQRIQDFFKNTPKRELGSLFRRTFIETLKRNSIDTELFRQGSFFTWMGKRKVPGTTSIGCPREMMRFLLLMDQGRLVDEFSSRELKRLMYMTQRRIRYASSPALYDAAVYFKSGSLYKCKPEPNFVCRKYQGNVLNLLNSIATVEYTAWDRDIYYLVVVQSNVLYKNSAVEHQTLGTYFHRIIERRHQPPQ